MMFARSLQARRVLVRQMSTRIIKQTSPTRTEPLKYNKLITEMQKTERVWHQYDLRLDKGPATEVNWGANRTVALNQTEPGQNGVVCAETIDYLDKRIGGFATVKTVDAMTLVNAVTEGEDDVFANRPAIADLVAQDYEPTLYERAGLVEMPSSERDPLDYYYNLYRLAYKSHVAGLGRPFMPHINGEVSGPGVAFTLSSGFCSVSENAKFVEKNAQFGWFPDSGSAYHLARCRYPQLGLYLALTGAPLKGFDIVAAGLAENFINTGDFGQFQYELRNFYSVKTTLNAFQVWADIGLATHDKDGAQFALLPQLDWIEECFSKGSVAEIKAALAAAATSESLAALDAINERAPLSIEIAFRLVRKAETLSFAELLNQEFTLATNLVNRPEYLEIGLPLQATQNVEAAKALTWPELPSEQQIDELFEAADTQRGLELDDIDFARPEVNLTHDIDPTLAHKNMYQFNPETIEVPDQRARTHTQNLYTPKGHWKK